MQEAKSVQELAQNPQETWFTRVYSKVKLG